MSTVSVSDVSSKSGRSDSVLRVDLREQSATGRRPPAARSDEVRRGDHADHREPNWTKSVTSTPHSPDTDAKSTHAVPADDERLDVGPAEHHVGDLDGGEVHRRHDHDVEEEAEVHGAESAHERAGRPEYRSS